ncbi:hypothetical protein Tco_0468157 [Tanacetum coccineum]
MILPADHVLRAVINARLPVPLLLLICFWSYLFHAVMLPYQVGDVPLACVPAVDYVQAVEVQKKDDQVKLLESTSHCFMPLVTPATGGSSSAAAPEVSAPAEVEPENVVPEDTYLDLTGTDEVVVTQLGKSKRKRLGKQSDTLPAKQLRKDHPSFATGTGGKTLAGLRQLMPTSPLVSRPSFQADVQAHVVQSARITDVPVYTVAATVTSARENVGITPTSDVAGSSQLETSEGSDDSFYESPFLNYAKAKHCMDYEQLYTEFNVGAARQICLELEVRSRAEHELELKEKLKGKYDARGRLLEEKDLEILRLKSLLVEEAGKAERAETAEDTDISLLDSRATYLKSALDDSKAACAEAESLITSLSPERDRLTSEVSTLHTAFQDFKEKAEAHQEKQAQLAVLKCFKSPEYQGILGHALVCVMDFGMQESLEAGYEHGVAGTPLSAVEAYNPEAARTSEARGDLGGHSSGKLLKTKKDAERGPKPIVGETSLSFALLNVHILVLRIGLGESSTFDSLLSPSRTFDEGDTDEALWNYGHSPIEACQILGS